ncbi:MAG: secretin and TonB N-terminal domain-containing protein, partial [Pseudomonadota bacterium]
MRQIKLPSGPVGPMLVVLAETYGITVIADNLLVKGKMSAAVAGSYDPEQALTAALSGTRLVAARDAEGAFIITKKKVAARKSRKGSDRKDVDPEEIVVLGRKSIRSYFDVPESVAVVAGEEIEREPLTDLYDIIDRIPNVNRDTQTG